MDGLHRSGDAQAGESGKIFGGEELGMFHTMGEVGKMMTGFVFPQKRVTVQHFPVRGVPNGVDGHRPARVGSADAHSQDILGAKQCEPKVV